MKNDDNHLKVIVTMKQELPKLIQKYSDRPWIIWLIVCLLRQQKKQNWLKEIHRKLNEINESESGVVPELPDWEFYYHGMGLCLSGPDNEIIDVDFHDEGCRTIDPYFFASRIMNLNRSECPEAKLKNWLPDKELIVAQIRELQGSILVPKKSHVFRFNEKSKSVLEYFESLNLDDPNMFNEFNELIDCTDVSMRVKYESEYKAWLLKKVNDKNTSIMAFEAILANLPNDTQISIAKRYLRKRIDHKFAAIVNDLKDAKNVPEQLILSALKKLNPDKHHPYIAHTICSFLMSRNIEIDKCIETLKNFSEKRIVKNYRGNPFDYELAHLTLSYSPKDGFPLLRRALRSATPAAVEATAALLAIIDEDWSNNELVRIAYENPFNDRPECMRYITAALLRSKNLEIKKLGVQFTPKSRQREEGDIGYTQDEVVDANIDEIFTYALDKAKVDIQQLNLNNIRAFALENNA